MPKLRKSLELLCSLEDDVEQDDSSEDIKLIDNDKTQDEKTEEKV